MQKGAQDVDILHWMGRAALELIGQGGLGYSFDPLVEDVSNTFGEAIKGLVYILPSLSTNFPDLGVQTCIQRAHSLPEPLANI